MKHILLILAFAASAFAQAAPVTVTASTGDAWVDLSLGDGVVLAVNAKGSQVAYQWRKDGVAIAGATSATLDLGTYSNAKAGAYDVVATNPYGSTTSKKLVLFTGSAPIVTSVTATKTPAK